MYDQASGLRFLTICKRTDGFCNEDLDCEPYKEKDWKTGVETCPHMDSREIRMPKRKGGYF